MRENVALEQQVEKRESDAQRSDADKQELILKAQELLHGYEREAAEKSALEERILLLQKKREEKEIDENCGLLKKQLADLRARLEEAELAKKQLQAKIAERDAEVLRLETTVRETRELCCEVVPAKRTSGEPRPGASVAPPSAQAKRGAGTAGAGASVYPQGGGRNGVEPLREDGDGRSRRDPFEQALLAKHGLAEPAPADHPSLLTKPPRAARTGRAPQREDADTKIPAPPSAASTSSTARSSQRSKSHDKPGFVAKRGEKTGVQRKLGPAELVPAQETRLLVPPPAPLPETAAQQQDLHSSQQLYRQVVRRNLDNARFAAKLPADDVYAADGTYEEDDSQGAVWGLPDGEGGDSDEEEELVPMQAG